VVDLLLPDGDGLDVVRGIKALNPDTRVVVLSAGDLSGAIEAGADEALSKDVPLLRVLSVLERRAWTTGRAAVGAR
jgi:DNA-binding NarL/FixJ family response regulator